MDDGKAPVTLESFIADDQEVANEMEVVVEKKGTGNDQHDMYRMGKKQEMRRNFKFLSIFGFTMVLMATWEAQLRYCGAVPTMYRSY